ncbi:MAG TPA: hypothetical protein VF746_19605 [Longimicrobium sp.]
MLVGGTGAHAGPHAHTHPALEGGAVALAAHTGAMFLVMSVAALAVYRVLGVEFLRRVWVNFDALWTGAMFLAGVVTLLAR